MIIEAFENTAILEAWLAAQGELDAAGVLSLLKSGQYSLFRQGAVDAYVTGGWAARSVAAQEALIVQGGTPSYAWDLYQAANGLMSELGAATGGAGGLTKVGPVAITKPPTVVQATPYGLTGVLSADVGVLGAAAAPLLGVSLGVALYESNPELWTKISQTLLPWAYPDSNKAPVLVDETGQTYMPKEAVEALKELFDEEGIGTESGSANTAYPELPATIPYTTATSTGDSAEAAQFAPVVALTSSTSWRWGWEPAGIEVKMFNTGTCSVICAASGSTSGIYSLRADGSLARKVITNWSTVTNDNRIARYAYAKHVSLNATPTTPTIEIPEADIPKAAWVAVFGDGVSGGYPEGTSEWGGNMVDIAALPTLPVLQDFGPTPSQDITSDWIPVSLPFDGSYGSVDPTVNPDPTTVTDPQKQVDHYYDPASVPYSLPDGSSAPNPIPDYNPDIEADPDTNPQEQPQPQPYDPDRYPNPTKPSSGGDSPSYPIPTIPLPFDSDAGLIAVYNPDQSILNAFAKWLWVTYQDATIEKIWNNPFDGVITLFELYCTPPNAGSRNIRSGFLDSGINCPIINRYTEINCGSIVIPEYWGNYLDYSPYSRAFVYLPFIGIVEVDVDDIVGHAVNITYRIDCYNGSCIAMIRVAKEDYDNLVYQFSGNCAVELPLSGGSQATIRAAIINATVWGLGSVVSGAVSALASPTALGQLSGATSAISGAAQATASALSAKSSVQHSGSFGASFGAMGEKTPYIIVRRPMQVQVPNYNLQYGFQSHKLVLIGECTGYLRAREVHVVSATATDEEKTMIEQMLKTGVYVTE